MRKLYVLAMPLDPVGNVSLALQIVILFLLVLGLLEVKQV